MTRGLRHATDPAVEDQEADDTASMNSTGLDLHKRNKFTKSEDAELVRYLAHPDRMISGALRGNKVYQEMCEEEQWAQRHSWLSWRRRYMRNMETYNERIAAEEAGRTYNALSPAEQRALDLRYERKKDRKRKRPEEDEEDEEEPDESEESGLQQGLESAEAGDPHAMALRPRKRQQPNRVSVSDEPEDLDDDHEDLEDDHEVPTPGEPPIQGDDSDAEFWEQYAQTANDMGYSAKRKRQAEYDPRKRHATSTTQQDELEEFECALRDLLG